MARGTSTMAAQDHLTVIVRHAPSLNGPGRIEGSAQQLLGERVTLNGGFTITGDLLVPGTPALRINSNSTFAGAVFGTGSPEPTGYLVMLNGAVSLGYLRVRTDPVTLPTVTPPPAPAGTRSVTITAVGQSIGNPATLRNLTLNGGVGQITVPPGNYGNFVANGGSGFTLGTAGATTPVVYQLQNLTLNGSTRLEVVGPIILTIANGFTGNGLLGATNQASWLQLQLASGGVTLNGGCTMHGNVQAPAGTVTINGGSCLIGSVKSDRLTINGNGCIKAAASTINLPQSRHAHPEPSAPQRTAPDLYPVPELSRPRLIHICVQRQSQKLDPCARRRRSDGRQRSSAGARRQL
jgi:rhamnogalacturonan endolyase